MISVNMYSKDGSVSGKTELPKVFGETVRGDLINRAVLSDMSKQYQPKGNFPRAGLETSAKYRGRKEAFASLKNRGQAKLPRTVRPKGRMGVVRRIPSSVKGRRAHPPKVEEVIIEEMNNKEYAKALRSAIAATAQTDLAIKRGHRLAKTIQLPLIFDETVNSLVKTKDMQKLLSSIIKDDLAKARVGRKHRVTRKRGYYEPKSALIVVSGEDKSAKVARNIPGVDVVALDKLKVSMLAPGSHPGRLTIYTKNAVEELRKW